MEKRRDRCVNDPFFYGCLRSEPGKFTAAKNGATVSKNTPITEELVTATKIVNLCNATIKIFVV
jgi:hypothetical protein